MEKIFTEQYIVKALRGYFNNNYTYRLENPYIFASNWESDFFCINTSGYSFEFEIKISRSDFFADFKKQKHLCFRGHDSTKRLTPNRFYYAVPCGLIDVGEIPTYAGLVTVSDRGHANIIKRAPFIHKIKHDFRTVLCNKFYHAWIEERRRCNIQKHNMESIKAILKESQGEKFVDYWA